MLRSQGAGTESSRVWLDAYHDEDEPAFIEWCGDTQSFAFLRKSWPAATSAHQLFQHLSGVSRSSPAGNRVWAVRVPGVSDPVGHIELKSTEKTSPDEGEAVLFIAAPIVEKGTVVTRFVCSWTRPAR